MVVFGLSAGGGIGCSSGVAIPSSVDTKPFDGDYVLDSQASVRSQRESFARGTDPRRIAEFEGLLAMATVEMTPLRIRHGVIHIGIGPTQELSLVEAEIDGLDLIGTAIWHEDVEDPGDSSEVIVALKRRAGVLELRIGDEAGMGAPWVYQVASN